MFVETVLETVWMSRGFYGLATMTVIGVPKWKVRENSWQCNVINYASLYSLQRPHTELLKKAVTLNIASEPPEEVRTVLFHRLLVFFEKDVAASGFYDMSKNFEVMPVGKYSTTVKPAQH